MKELHRRRWLLYNRLSGHHTNSILVSGGAAGHFAELRSAVFLQRFIDLSQCVMQRCHNVDTFNTLVLFVFLESFIDLSQRVTQRCDCLLFTPVAVVSPDLCRAESRGGCKKGAK